MVRSHTQVLNLAEPSRALSELQKKPPPKQGHLFGLESVPQEHLDCIGDPQRLSSGRGPGQHVEVGDGGQDRDDANERDHSERDLGLDRVGVVEVLAIVRRN